MSETLRVRDGEEIDIPRLSEYLRSKTDADTETVSVQQFPAGSSNLTYLVQLGDKEYVLRRPPFGNTVKSAHDMGREFNVLSKLSLVYPYAPKPLIFCDDDTVIGSEFYLMERRNGLILRGKSPVELEDSPGLQREVARAFINNLAELHSVDYAAAGLDDLGRPEGYSRRQVEGWTKRYFAAKTDEHPELESAIEWLNADIPEESGASLVHNDYKFDNVMLDPNDLTRVTAVLDWEMVTVGDPLMDLGTTLGYWMSAEAGEEMMRMPFNPYVLMKNISRQDLADIYAEFSGRDISNILYYYVFGTFKIAVICQQIYARYLMGMTKDPRFAGFASIVSRLGTSASQSVERKHL